MYVEILHIDDCENWQEAARRSRVALDEAGMPEVEVATRLIRTPEEALAAGFAGSPTILVDGTDAFPSEGQTADLACRIYPGPDGLVTAPTVDQLVTVFGERAR